MKVLSVSLVVLLPLVSCLSDSKTVSYDPKIECNLAELIWEYAKKLMPSRGEFSSVYDAVNLEKCNVSKYGGKSVENMLKKRYTSNCNFAFVFVNI